MDLAPRYDRRDMHGGDGVLHAVMGGLVPPGCWAEAVEVRVSVVDLARRYDWRDMHGGDGVLNPVMDEVAPQGCRAGEGEAHARGEAASVEHAGAGSGDRH